jgi:hypothetical protein
MSIGTKMAEPKKYYWLKLNKNEGVTVLIVELP